MNEERIVHASRNGYPACGAEPVVDEPVAGERVDTPITCTRCQVVLGFAGARLELHDFADWLRPVKS